MKQLTYVKTELLRWDDVPDPILPDADSALVRPFVVARCDLDAGFLLKNVSRLFRIGHTLGRVDTEATTLVQKDLLKGPFPFGHECVAEVLEVGANVQGFRRGDRVVVPFQVSCGECPICSRGITSQCEVNGRFDMYSGIGKHSIRGGMMSDIVVVPNARHMLTPVPESLDSLAIGSASDNLPDAWSRVAPELLNQPGKDVLVMAGSTRSISLYCAAFAVAMGARRVDYVDHSPERCEIARTLGANPIEKLNDIDRDYDLVINGSNRPKAIMDLARVVKGGGVLTSMNIYFTKSTPVPFFQLYAKNITLKTGLANPMVDIRPMLDFIAAKQIDLGAVTTHVGQWENAHTDLLKNTTKVMIQRSPIFT